MRFVLFKTVIFCIFTVATVIGRKGGVLNIDVTKAKPDVFPPQPRIKIWHVVTYPELLE